MVVGLSPQDQQRMLEEYDEERSERCHRWVRNASTLGCTLLLLFAPIDFFRPDAVFPIAFSARLIGALALAVIALLMTTEVSRRHPYAFGVAVLAVPTGVMLAMIPITGWHDSSYFPGVTMLMVISALMLAWETQWTALQCGFTIIAYTALTALIGGPPPMRFWENILMLFATTALAIIISRMRERLQLHEFERRWSVAEAYRNKSDFFANLSHEIRTPVHVILGYTDMLLDGDALPGPEDRRKLLERIRAQGSHLHLLLSDLLDSAKVEAGKMEIQHEGISVPELALEVVEGFRPLTEEKNLALSFESSPSVRSIVSDSGKIRQVLTNILGNAVKFTERGEIRVVVRGNCEIDPGEVGAMKFLNRTTAASIPGDGVAIFVSDTGIGMDSSAFEWLATDFHQATGNGTKFGGTGLGLSLSKKLVELLGGQLAAKSQVGAGTTFCVLLPDQPAHA